jgi:hypothetical protein
MNGPASKDVSNTFLPYDTRVRKSVGSDSTGSQSESLQS